MCCPQRHCLSDICIWQSSILSSFMWHLISYREEDCLRCSPVAYTKLAILSRGPDLGLGNSFQDRVWVMGDEEKWAHQHVSKYSNCVFSWTVPFQIFYPIFTPHISANFTKCSNILAKRLQLSERRDILTKPLSSFKIQSGSEFKAGSFLSLQYNRGSKCRIAKSEQYIEKYYTTSISPPLLDLDTLG